MPVTVSKAHIYNATISALGKHVFSTENAASVLGGIMVLLIGEEIHKNGLSLRKTLSRQVTHRFWTLAALKTGRH